MNTPQKIPVSLVLGSGGARGLAHIGVIRALDEDGRFEIAAITGTSIGALIGGLHAAGRLEPYTEWVRALTRRDIWNLLDFSFTRTGIFEGERLMKTLDDLVGNAQIESLPIPFTAVASDLDRRQEVWLNRGPLFEAIRASIAIPGLFTPVERDGRLLVDGGLLSPLPLAPAQHQPTELTIAVSLNGAQRVDIPPASASSPQTEPPDAEPASGRALVPVSPAVRQAPEPTGWFATLKRKLGLGNQAEPGAEAPRLRRDSDLDAIDIIARSVEAMQDRIARYQVAAYRADLLIEIPVDSCGVLDFDCSERMIELGYQAAKEALSHERRRAQATAALAPARI